MIPLFRDEEDGVLVAKEGEMEKRKVQEAAAEWQAEKRRRVEDGEEVDGDGDDEDVQDVQVCVFVLVFRRLFAAYLHTSFPLSLPGHAGYFVP